jgi:zinc/manganese transport system ATP-binding protein
MGEPAVELENLTLGYDRHPAVHHLSARVERGSLVALAGPNGGGKSTLLKGIIGQLRPLDGRIRLRGIARRDIAYLPQQAEIDRTFPMMAFDYVATGLWRRVGAWGGLRSPDLLAVADALAAVGLAEFGRRAIGSLSGGQFQRMLFARLLLQDAPLVLLDEPFNSVDEKTTQDLMAIIERWHGEGRTVIAVLHDAERVRGHFPLTLLLSRELVGFGPTESVLTPGNLLRARQLNEAFDERARVCAQAAE